MSKARTKTIKVVDDDITLQGPAQLILSVFLGGLLGTIGFTISWIAIELAFPVLFEVPNSFLIVVGVGTFGFAGLAWRRNQILRLIANRGFVVTFWSQVAIRGMFWVAVVLAVYALLARTGAILEYSLSLSLLFMGLYFLLAMPSLVFGRLIPRLREARLCMLQFLKDWNSGIPKVSTGHSWLRRSLRGVEHHLPAFGLSAPAGTLFLGSSYSIFKGTLSSLELQEIGDWLIKPGNWVRVNWTIPYLLIQAKAAEEGGFGKPLGILERLVRLPWRNSSYIIGIIVAIPGIIAAIPTLLRAAYEALRFLGIVQ